MITLMDEIKEQLDEATPITEERIQNLIDSLSTDEEERIRKKYQIGQKMIYFALERDKSDSEKQVDESEGVYNNIMIEIISITENKLSDIGEIYTLIPGRGTPSLPRLIYVDDEKRQESYKLWIEGNPPI